MTENTPIKGVTLTESWIVIVKDRIWFEYKGKKYACVIDGKVIEDSTLRDTRYVEDWNRLTPEQYSAIQQYTKEQE